MKTRNAKLFATEAQRHRDLHRVGSLIRLVCAVLCVFVSLWLMTATARGQAPTANLLRGVGIDQHMGAQVPMDLVFHDEAGSARKLGELSHGKPVVLVLVQYRCPSLCTVVLNDMLSTLKVIPQNVGDQFDVWTVSFDPNETPDLAMAKKQDYVKSYERTRPAAVNASAGWHFLTGDAEAIAGLTKAVGFRYRWDDATKQYVHPAGLMILTPEGKIARYFFGIDFEPTDLRLSLVEASGGKIGTPTDKLLLFCYHYDPATGKYGLAITNALRVGGGLTILLLGAMVGWLWRADRRRTRWLMSIHTDGGLPENGSGGHAPDVAGVGDG